MQGLTAVLANAALPQQAVIVTLVAALPLTFLAAALGWRGGARSERWRRIVAEMRVGAPIVGMLTGGLNSLHMAETIRRLPVDPTLKQLAPGISEVAMLVTLGALVGLAAVLAHLALPKAQQLAA